MSTAPDASSIAEPSAPRPLESNRRVVLVAGSGRSGTSTLSGILREFGLHVPQPEVAADQTNPSGFGEPQWVVDFHDELLRRGLVHPSDARPKAWFDTARLSAQESVREEVYAWMSQQFAEADELVIKDPRLVWFLGLWRVAAIRCTAAPCFATMLRPPTEVVGSKVKYYGGRLGDVNGMAAWVNLMLHTEQATRGSARVFIRYHDLLEDWTTSVFHTGEALDLKGVQHATAGQIQRVHGFVDPSLRRVQATWDDFTGPAPLLDLARDSWEQLNKLADPGGDTPEVHAALDELRVAYTEFYEEAEAVARSSIVAAAGRGARRGAKQAGEAGQADAPAPRGEGAAAAPSPKVDTLVDRIPHRVRARIPARLRQGARRALGAMRQEHP